jgi:hypothetical protein
MSISTQPAASMEPEIRALLSAEIEAVTGGSLNCLPIIVDGEMKSPTLDRILGGVLSGWLKPQSQPVA